MSNSWYSKCSTSQEKSLAEKILNKAYDVFSTDKSYKGILLCEGDESSTDCVLYSMVYPELLVMPCEACCSVERLVPRIQKHFEYPVYGIIDRDNLPKKDLRRLERSQRVYATKLPFIENIICSPEVIKVICKYEGKDYQSTLKNIRENLMRNLVERLTLLNPINAQMPSGCKIKNVSVIVETTDGTYDKKIDSSNVLYTFRNKTIVATAANALSMHDKKAYYEYIKAALQGTHKEEYIMAMSKYLPVITIEEQ